MVQKSSNPRGVIHSYADGRVEDSGPLTRKRMENVDEEFEAEAIKFIDQSVGAGKPLLCVVEHHRHALLDSSSG